MSRIWADRRRRGKKGGIRVPEPKGRLAGPGLCHPPPGSDGVSKPRWIAGRGSRQIEDLKKN